jgi:hypothetical protein
MAEYRMPELPVLPHLHHRRVAAYFAGRACQPTKRATRVANAGAELNRHPNYILAAFMASGT